MKLYYLKREKGRNEILETNIAIGFIIAITSRFIGTYLSTISCVSVGYLLPVLIMTVGSQIHR